jgi:CBS domain-containing protein
MDELDDIREPETGDEELAEIRGALLDARVATLGPADPICLPGSATVEEAIGRMLKRRQSGVLIVDGEGRLSGIFTERDVLTRVAGVGREPRRTALHEVMTPNPEALTTSDRIAYAVHCMSVAGYRTVPLVDAERRPIGVVTVSDVIRWLSQLFPEAVLNLPPGDTLKRPHEMDAG